MIEVVLGAVITTLGGLGAVWLGHKLKEKSRAGSKRPPAKPLESGNANDKRRLIATKLRLLERLYDLHGNWSRFEEKLDHPVTLYENGDRESVQYRETCDQLDALRDKLVSTLLELRPDVRYLEGSAAEVNTAERKLLQFGFRHGADRRVLAPYDHVDEYSGVAWFEGDKPRREARDAGLVIQVACRRLRQEAEDLFEQVRKPGEDPPLILLL